MKHVITEHELASGARGLLIEVPDTSVVNIVIRFNSGFQFGDRAHFELPHVMEHLIGCGTKKYPGPNQFKIEASKNGAYRNANTSTRCNGYVFECAEFELPRILDLLEEYMTAPTFPKEALPTELSNVREELSRTTTQHGSVCALALAQRTHPSVWVGLDERIEQLSGITRDMVVKHYEITHTAMNGRFYLAGAVGGKNRELILNKLDSIFSKLPGGKRLEPDLSEGIGEGAIITTKRDIAQLYYSFNMFAGSLTESQELAIRMLVGVLFVDFRSRIYGEARRRGLAYHVGGHWSGGGALPSAFGFGGFVTKENIGELMKLIAQEIAAVAKGGLREDELQAAKDQLRGSREIGHQTPGNLLGYYVGYYDFDGTVRSYDGELAALQAVSVKDVVDVARFMLKPENWAVSWLGDLDDATAAGYTAPLRSMFE